MIHIVKRDGRIAEFNKFKIVDAVLAAFEEVDGEVTEYAEIKAGNIADYIQEYAEAADHMLDIEEIQDLVERGLQSTKRKDVAKSYIIYRNDRTRERNKKSKMIQDVGIKLKGSNIENQNANVDEMSFGGRRGEATNVLMKQYALDYIMSPMARENHLNNEVYTHDLDSYAIGMHNCLSVPFDDLLANGFNTRQTDVRPANSINTAFQLVAVIFQLQSLQQFGGVSATHLDWTMVPYIRKSFYKHYCDGIKYISKKDFFYIPGSVGAIKITEDKWKEMSSFMCKHFSINDEYGYEDNEARQYAIDMTERETRQAVEGMYHNLNTLQSRSGN